MLILLLSLITPFASSSPDGLESVAEEFGFRKRWRSTLLEDYGISTINNNFVSTFLSALLGIASIAIITALFMKRRESGKNST